MNIAAAGKQPQEARVVGIAYKELVQAGGPLALCGGCLGALVIYRFPWVEVRHVVRALEARGEGHRCRLWYRAVSLGFEARDV